MGWRAMERRESGGAGREHGRRNAQKKQRELVLAVAL